MRYVICLLIGLAVGAISATTAASILGHRNAHPRALMRVMQHELGEAREATRSRSCADNPRRLATLDVLADGIGTAIPHGDPPDRVFGQYLDDLRKHLTSARSSDCKAQAAALAEVANACDACHRDYR